jgi:hypothetical protein
MIKYQFDPHNYNLSGMGPGENVVGESHGWNDIEQEETDIPFW